MGNKTTRSSTQRQLYNGWYQVDQLDSATYVIHEPRYWQKNNQYFIIGSEAALLFDSGSGRRKIAPLLQSLTSKPIMVLNSHAHYDHIGNNDEFNHIIMTNLAINKAQTSNDVFTPKWSMRLAPKRYSFQIKEWVNLYECIDLGDRSLMIIPLPGHSADHIGLVDEKNGYLFVADALYHAPLLANLPTANVKDYYHSSLLLQDIYANHKIIGNHNDIAPFMGQEQLTDLTAVCEKAINRQRHITDYINPFIKISYGSVTMYTSSSALNVSHSQET